MDALTPMRHLWNCLILRPDYSERASSVLWLLIPWLLVFLQHLRVEQLKKIHIFIFFKTRVNSLLFIVWYIVQFKWLSKQKSCMKLFFALKKYYRYPYIVWSFYLHEQHIPWLICKSISQCFGNLGGAWKIDFFFFKQDNFVFIYWRLLIDWKGVQGWAEHWSCILVFTLFIVQEPIGMHTNSWAVHFFKVFHKW